MVAAIGACLAIFIFTATAYHYQQGNIQRHLSTVAELKAHEIERWLAEKRSGLLESPESLLSRRFAQWREQPSDAAATIALKTTLAFYQKRHPDTSQIRLYGAQGERLFGTDADGLPQLPATLQTGNADDTPQLIDFYLNAQGQARLAFIVPLYRKAAPEGQLTGYAWFAIDPEKYLYPFIANWPGHDDSGESLLYRQRKGNIEFLNPLRYLHTQALSLKRPVDDPNLLAARLARGTDDLHSGLDYRNARVIGVQHPIEKTPWKLVAKMDAAEAFAPVWLASGLLTALLIALITTLALLTRRKHQLEHEKALLQQHTQDMHLLRTFIDAVPETLLMLRRDGHILLINQTGAARLRSRPENLIGSSLWDRLPAELAAARREAVSRAAAGTEALIYRDTRDEIEFCATLFPLQDGETVVIIATDETRTHANERALAESNSMLQHFIDQLPGTAYVKDHDSRVIIASAGFKRLLGMDPASMVGKLSTELFPDEFGEKIRSDDLRILNSGHTEFIEEELGGRHYESIKFPIPREGKPALLGGITLDVTARHQAERASRENATRLNGIAANLPGTALYQVTQEADGQRRICYASASIENLFGIPAKTLVENTHALLDRIDPALLPLLRQRQEETLNTRDFAIDLRIRRADDSWGWFAFRSRQRLGQNEAGQRVLDGTVSDITHIKANEENLDHQARRASALLHLPQEAEKMEEAAFMAYAIEIAEALTKSQIGFMHFVNEDQDSIELVAWSRNTLAHYCHAAFEKHYPISAAGIWANAAREKRPVVINDYASAPCKHGLPEGHSPLQRLISIPVINQGAIKMMAGVGNKAEPYTDMDVESLQLIANETWRIVQHRRQQQALLQSEAHFRAFFERSMVGMATTSPQKTWLEVNDTLCHILGYTRNELSQLGWDALTHHDDLALDNANFERVLAGDIDEYALEKRFIHKSGKTVETAIATRCIRHENGEPNYFVALFEDISARKLREREVSAALEAQRELNRKLEDAHNQLLQSEKLAAIGQLAAGVAHELNNPIGFVASNLGTLSEYCSALIKLCDTYSLATENQAAESPYLREIEYIKQDQDYNYLRSDIFPLLEESREGLTRVRKIVQDLRDFSRTGKHDWEAADLLKGLDSTLNIVANELKYKCTVRKAYTPLPDVECVISQINQVFMNLLVNAAQAIETQGEILLQSGLDGDEHVWVSISDTGKGISPENLNRIFEPFFTTKPVGIGTGLGLSLVFGIINRHQGRIDVSSEPNQGTTFRIVLPIKHLIDSDPSAPEAP